MKKKYQYQILNQYGDILSQHTTLALAEKQKTKTMQWRCGICGNDRGGWGKCSHGNHNLVCSAEHYNDYIEEIK